jgi:hypothetical protein
MLNEYAALHLVGNRHRALRAEADGLRQARLTRAAHRRTPPAGGPCWAWRRHLRLVAYRSQVLRRSPPCPEQPGVRRVPRLPAPRRPVHRRRPSSDRR